MHSYIIALIKRLIFFLKYGKKVTFEGLPRCGMWSKINVNKGNLFVGKHFTLKDYSYLAVVNGGTIRIQDNVYINRNCNFICHELISIGENTSVGPNVLVYDHDHCFGSEGITEGFKTAPVIIEKNCWIGAGCIILKGSHIGEGCIIGAGTIVKGNIPDHMIVTSERKIRIKSLFTEERFDV